MSAIAKRSLQGSLSFSEKDNATYQRSCLFLVFLIQYREKKNKGGETGVGE
jgi:hypothetical protein